jgi:hypothetical protein
VSEHPHDFAAALQLGGNTNGWREVPAAVPSDEQDVAHDHPPLL